MRFVNRWPLMFAMAAAVACSDSPSSTGPATGGPITGLGLSGPLVACNLNGTALPSFTKNYDCGHAIGVVAGSGWDASETSAVSGAIASAASNWAVALGQYNLPHFVSGGSGDVQISATGSGAQYCGSTLDAHTIVITRSTSNGCSNPTDLAHIGALFTHELGHAFGFSSWWHKFGDAGLDSTVGNCVMWLPQGAPLNSVNATPCMHEVEAIYTEYGVSGRGVLDFSKHIVTGVFPGPSPITLTVGTPSSETLTRVDFAGGNAAWIYGSGCALLAPSPWQLSSPPGGCVNRLGTVTLTWASSNPGVFSVVKQDSATAILTPVAPGSATLTLTLADPAGRYNIGSSFLAASEQLSAVVTVVKPVATAVKFTAGTGETAPVNSVLPINPTVQVTDANQNGISGDTVDFAIVAGGGSVGAASVVTNGSGYASTTWRLGTVAGSQVISATVHGTSLAGRDTATATAGPATVLLISSGNHQSGLVSTALPVNPTVQVADAYGNGVSGVSVQFAPTGLADGSVSPTSATTNASGLASTAWTLGLKARTDSMTATSSGLTGSPALFIATATTSSGALEVSSCRTAPYGGKTYDYFTLTWSGASSGTHQIYESLTNSPSGAYLVASGSGASGSVELGGYLQSTSPNNRYWWLDDVTPAVPNPTNVASCQL